MALDSCLTFPQWPDLSLPTPSDHLISSPETPAQPGLFSHLLPGGSGKVLDSSIFCSARHTPSFRDSKGKGIYLLVWFCFGT